MLINIRWRLKFPEGTIYHLPPFKSDHRPLLVQFKAERACNKRRRPFRFLAAWLTHDDFQRFMKCNWHKNMPWNHQMHRFKQDLEKWNKEIFGNIFARKKSLLRQLESINAQMVFNNNPHLVEQQYNIWKEYEEVLGQEEILWFQKSRSKWLAFGDKNSRYFHGITIVRRRRNMVEMI